MKRITLAAAIVLMAIMGLTAQTSSWNTLGNNIQTPSIYTYFLGTTNSYPLRFRTNNTDRMIINTSGNVGIGTTRPKQMLHIVDGNIGVGTNNPQAKLAVNGEILAKSVRVNTSNTYWPDYVFENDYNLMTLRELEQYVTANKHLPGIPSAAEVEKKGDVDLGAMNALLLEKVEELTRYVIDLQNQIDELKKGKE